MSYYFLLDVAMIIITTKLFGLLTRRIAMPQVVGALIAGLLLGPMGLDLLHETEFLTQVSEIGVIILMYTAGLETDIAELKSCGKASFIIAVLGVLVPLGVGYFIASFFNTGATLENVFIGVILTATSVSITVETLKEMGKLSTKSGNAILGAALIDDVLGIIALTIVTSLASKDVNVWIVMAKIVAFFALSVLIGYFLHHWINAWMMRSKNDKRRFSVLAFAFCLIYAFVAEEFFGVADITGAFIAGLIIANTKRAPYVAHRTESLGYMFFTPVFFASIGLKAVIPNLTSEIIIFSILITLAALITKIVGCGLGAKVCHYSNGDALKVGIGMISRGEVALIIASKGIAMHIMSNAYFAPMIIMVIFTTVITPILLKVVYHEKEAVVDNELTRAYQQRNDFELEYNEWINAHNFKDYTKSM